MSATNSVQIQQQHLPITIQLADPSNDDQIRQMLEIYRPFVEKKTKMQTSSPESEHDQQQQQQQPRDSNPDQYIPWITSFEEALPSVEEFRTRIVKCFQDGYIWLVATLTKPPTTRMKDQAKQQVVNDDDDDRQGNGGEPDANINYVGNNDDDDENNSVILGYSYCTVFRARAAYRITAEVAVYTYQEKTHGSDFFSRSFLRSPPPRLLQPPSSPPLPSSLRGIGKALYQVLFDEMVKVGFENAIGFVSIPNPVSIKAHEAWGFETVGKLPNIANKWGISCGAQILQKDLRKMRTQEQHEQFAGTANVNAIRCDVKNFLPRQGYVQVKV